MTPQENIGIKFTDGPYAGWANVYPMDWPPPEEVVAFTYQGKVAVTTPEYENQAKTISEGAVQRYRITGQSKLPEPHTNIARGATYKAVK